MWPFWTLAALSVITWPHPPDRSAYLHPHHFPHRRNRSLDPKTRRAAMILTALLTVSALFASSFMVVMAPVAVGVALMSRKLPIKPPADLRSAERQQLTVICGLFATCLSAGMPAGAALTAVLNELAPEGRAVITQGSPHVGAAQKVNSG